MRRALLAIAIGCAAQAAGEPLAWADAISPPPACPPGSRGRSSHAGEWCEPAPCSTDADCSREGNLCRPWRVCTQVSSAQMGSRRMGDRPPTDVTLVVGSCSPDRACRGTEEPPPETIGELKAEPPVCTNATYCVPPDLPELPTAAPAQGPAGPSGSRAGTPGVPGTQVGGAKGCGCRLGDRVQAGVGFASLGIALIVGVGLRRRRRANGARTCRGPA